MIFIPRIPEGRIQFGKEDWIACAKARGELSDVLDRSWVARKRLAVYSDKRETKTAICEICDEPVMNGNHFSRGHMLWLHRGCVDIAEGFIKQIDAAHPSIQTEAVIDEPSVFDL